MISMALLTFCVWLGKYAHKKFGGKDLGFGDDFGVILGATLTILGLLIGFSFSMAVSRYDQRKNYEEQEANAIGTEYVRVDFLPEAPAAKARDLLKQYTTERVAFYRETNRGNLPAINARTQNLQDELWATVAEPVKSAPSPVVALAASGMNDVLNSAGYTQAAWWNRIPRAAWALLGIISMMCCLMIGYGGRSRDSKLGYMSVLPLIVSIALFLIADIDTPRGGVIRIVPQNLLALEATLR